MILDGSYKWLRQLKENRFFLLDMERIFFLSPIQSMSLYQLMEWDLIEEQSRVSLGRISHHIVVLAGHDKNVVRLLPGSLKAEYPEGETPHQAPMFINQFMVMKGNFPRGEFRALGWVHSLDKYWWSRMVGFVLEDLKDELL